MLRRVVVVVALAAAIVAVLSWRAFAGDVVAADGTHCSSAWRGSNRTLRFTGERAPGEAEAMLDACQQASTPHVDRGKKLGATAAGIGIVAAGLGLAARRRTSDPAS